MANPIVIRDKLLAEHATLLRSNGPHPVYKLSNGEQVTISKTPGNDITVWAEVRKIKHKLGIVGKDDGEPIPTEVEKDVLVVELAEPVTPTPEPVPTKSAVQIRVDSKVEELETRKRELTEKRTILDREIEGVETEILRMSKVLDLIADPDMADVLSLLVAEKPKRERVISTKSGRQCKYCSAIVGFRWVNRHIQKEHPAEWAKIQNSPPQSITDSGQITEQMVLAATQTFIKDFTVFQVIEVMLNGKKPEQAELSRIRQLTSAAMSRLHTQGKVKQVTAGYGRRPAWWRKVDLTQIGKTK